MREAIGATWITGIVLAFIALFSGYLALSINYSKAFKVKDGIVDRIEKHGGPNAASLNDIANMLEEIGYNSKGNCSVIDSAHNSYIGVNKSSPSGRNPGSGTYNYCLMKINSKNNTPAGIAGDNKGQFESAYYRVVVFFSLSLPIVQDFANFYITGETININYPEDDYMD